MHKFIPQVDHLQMLLYTLVLSRHNALLAYYFDMHAVLLRRYIACTHLTGSPDIRDHLVHHLSV